MAEPAAFWPPYLTAKDATLAGAVAGLRAAEQSPADVYMVGQQAQLLNLLRAAVKQVPWYARGGWAREALAALESAPQEFWTQWRRLPLLTKPQLREHGPQLKSRAVPAAHQPLGSVSSSGSTGIPVEVATTAVTRLAWDAQTVREHLWRGRDFSLRLGAVRALKPEQRNPAGLDFPNWGSPVGRLMRTGPASLMHIGLDLELVHAWLARFDPHYLLAYPSLVQALLDLPGGKPPALREVRLMSEPVDPALEARIRAEWGVPVADVYSANEVGNIAVRCGAGRLHTLPETILVEILDERGEPCPAGTPGRVVLTPLHNLAQPLLRYEIGDYATPGDGCPCGRPHPVLERVQGRVRNMAVRPDGVRFWPAGLLLVRDVAPIRQFQYVQTAPGTIELRVVLERPLTADEQALAVARAQRALAWPFRIEVVPVPAIGRGPGGKFEEFMSLLQ